MNPAGEGAQATVLVVDDSPANVRLLADHLEANGFAVAVAQEGEEGIRRARLVMPDLILLDVKMKGLGGFETCRRLKADALTRDIPVIFMTVINEMQAKIAAFEAGAADYLTKPFHIDEVLARVNTQLRLGRVQKLLAQQNALLQQEVAVRVQAEEQVRELNTELEARVRQRTSQLEAANRELQAFCHSVAHDLRGPLSAIDGFTCLLGESLQDVPGERGQRYLGRIRSGVKHMADLTDALLGLAHLTLHEPRRESVDLGAMAASALQRLRKQEPARAVQVDVQDGLEVEGDPGLLQMVVEHLVGNAWKFSQPQAAARITVGSRQEAGERVYFVQDNGVGFDMAYADKLFKPFQRLHGPSEFPGLGIGLAVVERIVTQHGGRVWAQAAPGSGASLCFTLGRPR